MKTLVNVGYITFSKNKRNSERQFISVDFHSTTKTINNDKDINVLDGDMTGF